MSAVLIIILSLTDLLSFTLNGIVIYTFFLMRNSLTFKDFMMIGIAIGDMLQSVLGYPLEIYSSQQGQWVLNIIFCKVVKVGSGSIGFLRETCRVVNFFPFKADEKVLVSLLDTRAAGFFVTFLGLVSINYLAILSADLYLSICKPFVAANFHESFKGTFWTNAFPWIFSFFWAIAPVIGWSSYALEADELRCSINWNGKSLADMTYVAMLFIFCYLAPLGVMCVCFYKVKLELRNMRKRALELTSHQSEIAFENFRAEKRHTKLAFVMTTSFMISWTPYAVISFLSSYFSAYVTVPISLGTVAAVFAKVSTILNPIIYSFMYARFRQNMAIPCFGKIFRNNAVHHSTTNFTSAAKSRSFAEQTSNAAAAVQPPTAVASLESKF
eukprot:gene20241-22222_t